MEPYFSLVVLILQSLVCGTLSVFLCIDQAMKSSFCIFSGLRGNYNRPKKNFKIDASTKINLCPQLLSFILQICSKGVQDKLAAVSLTSPLSPARLFVLSKKILKFISSLSKFLCIANNISVD